MKSNFGFGGMTMSKKIETVERTVMSVSLSVNDKNKLKELAAKHEMTSSALLSQWIKEKYQEEIADAGK